MNWLPFVAVYFIGSLTFSIFIGKVIKRGGGK